MNYGTFSQTNISTISLISVSLTLQKDDLN